MAIAAPTKKKNKKNWQGLFNTDKAKNDPTGNIGDVLGEVGKTAIKQAQRKGGMGPNAREKNDNTRRVHADERNARIDAKKGDLTEFDKTFLATKGGRKGAPSGDWQHPFETPLESIKRKRMSPEAEKAASKAMPGQTVGDPQEALARGAAAVAATKALQGPMDAAGDLMPQDVKKNANGTPVAYRNGVPVGFSGKPPEDVIGDAGERSMVNKTGLFGPSERGAIRDQTQGVANEGPNTARAAAIAATMKSLGGGGASAPAAPHVDSEGAGDETSGAEERSEGHVAGAQQPIVPVGDQIANKKAYLGAAPTDVGDALAAFAPIKPQLDEMPTPGRNNYVIPGSDSAEQQAIQDAAYGIKETPLAGIDNPLAAFVSHPIRNMLNAGGDQAQMQKLIPQFTKTPGNGSYVPGNFRDFKANRGALDSEMQAGNIVEQPNPDKGERTGLLGPYKTAVRDKVLKRRVPTYTQLPWNQAM